MGDLIRYRHVLATEHISGAAISPQPHHLTSPPTRYHHHSHRKTTGGGHVAYVTKVSHGKRAYDAAPAHLHLTATDPRTLTTRHTQRNMLGQ